MAKVNVISKLLLAKDRLDVNQGELAEMLGVSQPTMSRVLGGRQRIDAQFAAKLAKAGLCTIEEALHYQYRKDCESAKDYPVYSVDQDCLK